MKRRSELIAVGLLAACVVLLTACGGEGEKQAEGTESGAACDGNGKKDSGAGKTPGSEAKAPAPTPEPKAPAKPAAGTASLPDKFPKEVPLYPGAKLVRVDTRFDYPCPLLTTTDSIDDISAFYRKAMLGVGWKEHPKMDIPTGGRVLNFRTEVMTISIQITPRPDHTRIRLTPYPMPKKK